MASNFRGRRWVATLNNFTADECRRIRNGINAASVKYAIFGKEVSATGTPHLQGFMHFHNLKRFTQIQKMVGSRDQGAKGTDRQNKEYCGKEGNLLLEIGTPSTGPAKGGADFNTMVKERVDGVSAAEMAFQTKFAAIRTVRVKCREGSNIGTE